MRSRFVIPAAILVAAAYLKGRQDALLFAPAATRMAAGMTNRLRTRGPPFHPAP